MQFDMYSLDDLAKVGKTVFHTRAGVKTIEQVKEWLELGEIVRLFDTWAVTEDGVECLLEYYPITKNQLNHRWLDHMAEKSWMSAGMLRDLMNALEYAKEYFGVTTHTGLASRFAIFKRDGYKCQLCGRTAAHGAVLEVDHKIPRAKGETDDRSNLWTLCFDCNRGKRDSTL